MTQASAGIGISAPTASMRPLRTRTVPRGITGALTGTTRAFRIATTEGTSAWSAQTATIANRNRFIVLIAYYRVSQNTMGPETPQAKACATNELWRRGNE